MEIIKGTSRVYVGIDPGGKRALGWAVLRTGADQHPDSLKTGCCTGVNEAIRCMAEYIPDVPRAAGVDAPLYWSRSGDRAADVGIRAMVRKSGGHAATVGHVNSLRGACLVQGILAAVALRERWPTMEITEAHPKALLIVSRDSAEFVRQFQFPNLHERDAALAAYAALSFDASVQGWSDWKLKDQEVFTPVAGAIAYWFPDDR